MLSTAASSAEDINKELHTLEDTVQDAEGNTYRTVQIGNQTWLAENLRATKFQDGSAIETAFIPNDKEENLPKYGRLYNWADANDERGICPVGWRVPSDDDWKELESFIGMSDEDLDKTGWRGDDDIAITLKETQKDSMFRKFDQSQVNKHKFFARPSGVKWKNWYITQGLYTEFWTSTSASEKDAYNRTLSYYAMNTHRGEIYRTTLGKDYAFAVRCIKN